MQAHQESLRAMSYTSVRVPMLIATGLFLYCRIDAVCDSLFEINQFQWIIPLTS